MPPAAPSTLWRMTTPTREQLADSAGQTVRVRLSDGTEHMGVLGEPDDEGTVTLETDEGEQRLSVDDLEQVAVRVTSSEPE